ncbi:hypothetical protein XENOCAPTIV_021047 [Xenoophorus captivus]|uniref:Uncharacterized protein n=1 Tax=Xenoophorus captivus TaxID=1517983 RepID=A0ABV0QKM7_9TELE
MSRQRVDTSAGDHDSPWRKRAKVQSPSWQEVDFLRAEDEKLKALLGTPAPSLPPRTQEDPWDSGGGLDELKSMRASNSDILPSSNRIQGTEVGEFAGPSPSAVAVHHCYRCGPADGPAVRMPLWEEQGAGTFYRLSHWVVEAVVLVYGSVLHPQVSCVILPGGSGKGFYLLDVARGSALASASRAMADYPVLCETAGISHPLCLLPLAVRK